MINNSKFAIILFLLNSVQAFSQPFLKRDSDSPLTFKQMQLQFDQWKKSNDISKKKNWKYFKRWEMETQLHTNAKGIPVDPKIYIDEVTRIANEKQEIQSRNSNNSVWLPTGPNNLPENLTGYMENGIGRINCIAFDPNIPSKYYIGVAQGGVWKTDNNGQSWTPLTDNLPITRVSDIAIDPNNTDVIYVSVCDFEYIGVSLNLNGRKRNTHYGLGVFKTSNGGNTWTQTGLGFQLTDGDASLIKKIIVNPANGNKLVACGTSGMYVSNNGGTNWTRTMDSLFWDLIIDPNDPNTLYAAGGWVATSNTGYSAIYKSTDFGNTWTMLNTNIPATGAVQRIKLAIGSSNSSYIYAAAVNIDQGLYGIYKSVDAGSNWEFLPPTLNLLDYDQGLNPGGQGNYDLALTVDPINENYLYIGGINVWGSKDAALSFTPVSHWTTSYGPTIHGDIHFMSYQPLTGNFFVCSDGGLYRTTNIVTQTWDDAFNGFPWPTLWTKLNDGLQITSFYRISSSKNSSDKLLAGAQDNASILFDGNTWRTVNGGDGMDNCMDPLNDNNNITSSQYGNFAQTSDNGFTYNTLNVNVNAEVAEWTSPLIADNNQPGTYYAGFANVSKSDDGGSNWYSISNFPSNGIANNEISALAVANTNSNVLYAAKRVRYEYQINGTVYNTLDGGVTWNDVTNGLPDSLYFTSLEVNANNANEAYITMAGFTDGVKVFRTQDNGQTWQNISFNLPNLPINCIKSLRASNLLLVATDIGIYSLDLNEQLWQNNSLGLPNVIITDIEVNEAVNKIYISTFGRGIWQTDFSLLVNTNTEKIVGRDFELYPSINNGTFSIKNPLNENSLVNIYDITGRKIYESNFSTSKSFNLDVSNGRYFAKITSGKNSCVKSFIVSK